MQDVAGAPGRFLHDLIYGGGWRKYKALQDPRMQALFLKKYGELSDDIMLGNEMKGQAFGRGDTFEDRWQAKHDALYAPDKDVLPSDRDIAPVDKKTPIDDEANAPGVKEGLKNADSPDLISEEELKSLQYDALGMPKPGEYGQDPEKPEPWEGPEGYTPDSEFSNLEKGIAVDLGPEGSIERLRKRAKIVREAGGKMGSGSFSGGADSQKGITMDGEAIEAYNARHAAQNKRDWAMNRARQLAARGGVSGRAIDKQEQLALMEMETNQQYNDALDGRAQKNYEATLASNEGANRRALFKEQAQALRDKQKQNLESVSLWDDDIETLNKVGATSAALLVSRVAKLRNLSVEERQHKIDMILLAEAEKEESPLFGTEIGAIIKQGAGRPNQREGASLFDQAVFGQ